MPNLHPIFVHFTIALYTATVVLYLASLVLSTWAKSLLVAARINLWLGALLSVATVGAGVKAYLTVPHDLSLQPNLNDHRNWAIATALLWWLIALVEVGRARYQRQQALLVALVLICAMVPLVITGGKGGDLVYHDGIGVTVMASSPKQ